MRPWDAAQQRYGVAICEKLGSTQGERSVYDGILRDQPAILDFDG